MRPAPTAQKIARGNPGKRKLNDREPQPSLELPPCPDDLSPVAKQAWNDLVPELARIGILSSIDMNAFTRYCVNLGLWRDCREFLRQNGYDLIVKDEEGKITGVVPYPQGKRLREIEVLLLRYETEYGMTPSSRSKVRAVQADQGDALDELLGNTLRIAK